MANEQQRPEIVKRYFVEPGTFDRIELIDHSRRTGFSSDPIWAVIGYKKKS